MQPNRLINLDNLITKQLYFLRLWKKKEGQEIHAHVSMR